VSLKDGDLTRVGGRNPCSLYSWLIKPVVKSQEEALQSGQVYDYCLLTTKCLPDILPNSKLLAPSLASDQIKSYALIQNGLDVEKDIHAALQEKGTADDVPIVSAAAWIGLMTSPDGKRISWSGPRVRLEAFDLSGTEISRMAASLPLELIHLLPRTLRMFRRKRAGKRQQCLPDCWKKVDIL
jgi:hypothetical protein